MSSLAACDLDGVRPTAAPLTGPVRLSPPASACWTASCAEKQMTHGAEPERAMADQHGRSCTFIAFRQVLRVVRLIVSTASSNPIRKASRTPSKWASFELTLFFFLMALALMPIPLCDMFNYNKKFTWAVNQTTTHELLA